MKHDFFQEIKKELFEIKDRIPTISEDNAFVVWFLKAFVTDSEDEAFQAIAGMANDKGCDAVYLDHKNRMVFIVQGKYHKFSEPNAKLSDVIALAVLGRCVLLESKEPFESLLNKANSIVQQKLVEARTQIHRNNYQLVLNFVTTGKVSSVHLRQAEDNIDEFENARFQSYSRSDLLTLMQDYLEGAAPPVPTIQLPVTGGEVFNRMDQETGITSWIFTMQGADVGQLYETMGIRLFARNIRGYLGTSTEVNRIMKVTIEREPEFFWYYNNGITIVCDNAKQIKDGQTNKLKVINAQIINGQQTTRTLSQNLKNDAEVLVKLIQIPRSEENRSKYKHVISEIVSATNFQNAISQSDLKSNDEEQVRIEKELKKYDYFYIRKRMSKSESVKYGSNKYNFIIKRNVLARAVGAVTIDPYEVRLGVNRLFEDDVYGKIFNGRSVSEYLAIYWLFNEVEYWSKGNEIFSYSKWWTLNLLWKLLAQDFKRSIIKNNFRVMYERVNKYSVELKPLEHLIKKLLATSREFYLENKRNYGKPQVPRDYFKHVNLHKEFNNHFIKLPATKRNAIKKDIDKFINNISSFD